MTDKGECDMETQKGYVDPAYLQAVGEYLKKLKQRTYSCMQLEVGHKVIDVGCGPGTDTIPLANLVGNTGYVVGVDYAPEMITEADAYAEKSGVSGWVEHKQADASSLPIEDSIFDSCRSERLFQHIQDPVLTLDEMTRVTKPDGWVVALDSDWSSGSIDTPEIEIERKLVKFNADQLFHNGYAGRELYRLFVKQGLKDIICEIFPIMTTNYAFARQMWVLDQLEVAALEKGVITEAELERLRTSLEQAEAEGVFFGYGCMILVAGVK
jgi:ubiquinone/menaquinone biosynthesis C-methylase UbiE